MVGVGTGDDDGDPNGTGKAGRVGLGPSNHLGLDVQTAGAGVDVGVAADPASHRGVAVGVGLGSAAGAEQREGLEVRLGPDHRIEEGVGVDAAGTGRRDHGTVAGATATGRTEADEHRAFIDGLGVFLRPNRKLNKPNPGTNPNFRILTNPRNHRRRCLMRQ